MPPHTFRAASVVVITAISLLGTSSFAADNAAEASAKQICNKEGAFGFRFGDRFVGTGVPKDSFFFGRGCYQVSPTVEHPSFDVCAVCISEFDGKIYQFQASKTFDTKLPPGSKSLSPAQVRSNSQLGKHVLEGMLAELPTAVASEAKFNEEGTEWSLFVNDGVRLEVSNHRWMGCKHGVPQRVDGTSGLSPADPWRSLTARDVAILRRAI